jgi:two-component system, chemotaxis family, protein-glutamate methylesterase/glutaminase
MTKAVVIGTSAGGIEALEYLLPQIPADSVVPVFVVQHITSDSDSYFIKFIKDKCFVKVKEACHTEEIKPGVIYFAPPDYHLLIEDNETLALGSDEKVNFSRPSIDVLFETASEVYHENLTGILLTGSNSDGSSGLFKIHLLGGKTIVQDPKKAFMSTMPESAIRLFRPDSILSLNEIGKLLANINSI